MYKESFHARIKKARTDAELTQMQVAQDTGISQSIIAYLETGKREPSLENLGILADYYNVSIDYLLGTKKRE